MASISFCNGSAFKINNDGLKEKIFLECEKLFGHKLKRDYFPGPQPVAIEKKDITVLKKNKNKYVVCEKSDGERYVMILINIDNKPMGFIINRNNEIYFLSMSFKKEIFEGSVFDGELIKTKTKETWHYLIHDCMSYNGKSFIQKNHDLRYACIIDFITKRYVHKESDCFFIKTKLFYNYGPEIVKTWEHIKETTENEIDGLILTPVNEPFTFGRQYSLLKWKDNHTIDLLAKKIGKKINLYGVKKGINYIVKTITEQPESQKSQGCFAESQKSQGCFADSLEDKLNKLSLKKNTESVNQFKLITDFCKPDQLKSGIIIEFNYILEEDLFKPYRFRLDKDFPNSEITINNTFKNIEEAISINELY